MVEKLTKDLNDLGINEKSDLRFISEEMLNQLDPPMAFPTRKKCFKLKKDLGGIMAKSEIDKYLVSRTQKIAKAASSAVSHQHTMVGTLAHWLPNSADGEAGRQGKAGRQVRQAGRIRW